jgi:hypothetical protein
LRIGRFADPVGGGNSLKPNRDSDATQCPLSLSTRATLFARHKVRDHRARFQVGDAQALPVSNTSFDAMVAGLFINFAPDQNKAVVR